MVAPPGEKVKWEQYKDTVCCLHQFLEEAH